MISFHQLAVFFMILARIAGVFIQAPIFNSRSIPFLAKTAIAVWLSIVLWFVTPVKALPASFLLFVLFLVSEAAIGFIIGFICNVIFIAVQSAGEIMDMQMGLSVATALDPLFGAVISVIGRMTFYLALIIFITANGHHMLLSALHQSFTFLPVGMFANFTSPKLAVQMIEIGSLLWVTAIKLSVPIVLLIFIADFTFGIVSRVAPQVNVFMLGFQVKPLLGLVGIMFALPFMVKYINHLLELMVQQVALLSVSLK